MVYHWSRRQQNPDHIKFQDAQKLISSVSPLRKEPTDGTWNGPTDRLAEYAIPSMMPLSVTYTNRLFTIEESIIFRKETK